MTASTATTRRRPCCRCTSTCTYEYRTRWHGGPGHRPGSGDGLLQKDELERALIDLNLYSSKADFDNLFKLLDADSSGALSWDEFKILANRSAQSNLIVDYIPLSSK